MVKLLNAVFKKGSEVDLREAFKLMAQERLSFEAELLLTALLAQDGAIVNLGVVE